jgi:hypothetical protein
MILTSRIATPGELGFDTISVLDADVAARFVAAGFTFAFRYVETVTRSEIEALTRAGLGILLGGYARTHSWNASTGAADGARIAGAALALDFPPDATLWCDQEDGVPSEAVAVEYATAWWLAATREGSLDPGLYVGAGSGFENSGVLHRAVPFRRYWRSFSQVPNVDVRGYQLLQLFPPSQVVAGVRIDRDVVQSDYLGGLPVLAVAAN